MSSASLVSKIGYGFQQSELLELALTHRSFSGKDNNERLEFLGDSILNFIIGEALFHQFPHAKEGQLSRLRASLVKGVTLTKIAQQLELGPFLRLGPGELKSGGARRDSILADAVEAVIGAVYMDGGMEQCKALVLRWFAPRLQGLTLNDTVKDNKTRLQELLQAHKLPLPAYNILSVEGASHSQHFVVECVVDEANLACRGEGHSRRLAEQMAAGLALDALENSGTGS